MTAYLILAGACVLAWCWWLLATAPLGYEDSDGFHYGELSEDNEQ